MRHFPLCVELFRETIVVGFKFFGFEIYREHIQKRLLSLEVHYYPISENHLGELKITTIGQRIEYGSLKDAIDKSLAEAGVRI